MEIILKSRNKIYEYFNSNSRCEDIFFDDEERLSSYYNSMFLIRDTSLGLISHRESDFFKHIHIELWGVMQAIIIQQDSIRELFYAVTGTKLKTNDIPAWQEIRSLRNKCAGHPSKKELPKIQPTTKVFFSSVTYAHFRYEKWTLNGVTHPTINLGELIDSYAVEANDKLIEILDLLVQVCESSGE